MRALNITICAHNGLMIFPPYLPRPRGKGQKRKGRKNKNLLKKEERGAGLRKPNEIGSCYPCVRANETD